LTETGYAITSLTAAAVGRATEEIPLSCACDAAAGPRGWGVLALLGLVVTRARRRSG
jgi:MYXO-CTERM domain-containing protein